MKTSLLSITALALTATMSQAITVTPYTTVAMTSIDGATVPNSGLPNSYSESTASGSDFSAKVTAYQSETGFSQLSLDITSYEDFGSFAADAVSSHTTNGQANLSLRYTNEGSITENPFFDFTLRDVSLHTFNASSDPGPEAEVNFEILKLTSSGVQSLFQAGATLEGNYNNPTLTNMSGFTGTVTKSRCSYGVCYGGEAQLNGFSETLSLGAIAPGETAELLILFSGEGRFNGYETGAEVFAIDPNGIYSYNISTGTTGPTNPSPVPLPASIMLGLGGIAALFGLKRRKRSAS